MKIQSDRRASEPKEIKIKLKLEYILKLWYDKHYKVEMKKNFVKLNNRYLENQSSIRLDSFVNLWRKSTKIRKY